METLNRTMSEQTQRLVKGLEYLLKAREEIYSSFTGAYGEEQGEKMYCDAFDADMNDLLMTLRHNIGLSMEVNMSDLTKMVF